MNLLFLCLLSILCLLFYAFTCASALPYPSGKSYILQWALQMNLTVSWTSATPETSDSLYVTFKHTISVMPIDTPTVQTHGWEHPGIHMVCKILVFNSHAPLLVF